VSGSEDKQVKVWDIEKASNVFSIACGRSVKIVKTNTVEPVVYTGHGDGSLRIYSLSQGNAPVSQIKGLIDYPISSITIVSDNRYQILVSSLEGSSCHLLDMKMNKSIAKFEHKDFFNSSTQTCFSPSEAFVLAGNCDGSIYYWDRFKLDMVKKVSGHDGAITAINYNFMSSLLASADKEGSLIIWQ
jgi:WD40 repeat protein